MIRPIIGIIIALALVQSQLAPAFAEEGTPEDAPAEQSNRTTARRGKHGIPRYHFSRPQWGFELAAATKVFEGSAALAASSSTAFAASFQTEFQPQFLQALGVFGLGPSLTVYPVSGAGVTNSKLGVWSAGGQVRYQLRFFREQVIVPMAAYSYERIAYSLTSGQKGSFTAKGQTLGVFVLLNPFDTDAAADFYVNTGITRSYLVLEYRNPKGSSDVLTTEKASYFLGLRMEM